MGFSIVVLCCIDRDCGRETGRAQPRAVASASGKNHARGVAVQKPEWRFHPGIPQRRRDGGTQRTTGKSRFTSSWSHRTTSAMTYKYSHRTIREIGKELGVDYVLEGSVRRSGSEVRVTAQLVQVSDEAHVWAANYDKNLRNLLQLESDLAKEIARQVGVSIAISHAKKPVQQHVPSPEAHEAYLLGRYNWYKRTQAGWKSGEDYFRLAIQEDPEYAAAYAALAECRIPKGEAQAAALKAIALDPTSGEAYTALAWVQLYWSLDPAAAGPAFERAIELAPNYAQAHYSYAQYLQTAGPPDEAVSEVKQAIALDPLSALFNSGL